MDPHFAEIFSKPPIRAFKRQKNIKDSLIKAKTYQKKRKYPQRNLIGMKRCKSGCTMCPYVKTGTNIENTNFTWKIRKNVDCNTTNVIYMIECTKETCKEKYIGESERTVKKRFDEHRGYVKNKIISKATGSHFN